MDKILHILTGAIGTGKSTFAKEFSESHKIPIISGDKIEEESSTKDENEINSDLMLDFNYALDSESSFIIDCQNLNKYSRSLFIKPAARLGYKIVCHDFGPGDENSLNQRLNEPRGVDKERWKAIAKENKEAYEKPELSEGINKINTKY
jgi:predicted kinase